MSEVVSHVVVNMAVLYFDTASIDQANDDDWSNGSIPSSDRGKSPMHCACASIVYYYPRSFGLHERDLSKQLLKG